LVLIFILISSCNFHFISLFFLFSTESVKQPENTYQLPNKKNNHNNNL
jgi:hypothetical protein